MKITGVRSLKSKMLRLEHELECDAKRVLVDVGGHEQNDEVSRVTLALRDIAHRMGELARSLDGLEEDMNRRVNNGEAGRGGCGDR